MPALTAVAEGIDRRTKLFLTVRIGEITNGNKGELGMCVEDRGYERREDPLLRPITSLLLLTRRSVSNFQESFIQYTVLLSRLHAQSRLTLD
jgi:hypothetical protein